MQEYFEGKNLRQFKLVKVLASMPVMIATCRTTRIPRVLCSHVCSNKQVLSLPRHYFSCLDSHTLTSLQTLLTSNGKEREHTAVSIVVGLKFSLSTAYTLGDMGSRSDGDCGSAESLRLRRENKVNIEKD